MEPALRAVCKDVRIGKILIQTNLDSGEPEVEKYESFTIKSMCMLCFQDFTRSWVCLKNHIKQKMKMF